MRSNDYFFNQNPITLSILSSILRALRFNEWWNYKIPPLIGFFALMVYGEGVEMVEAMSGLGKIMVWLLGAAAFGYFTNDLFDVEEDARVGKANAASGFSRVQQGLIGLLLALIAVAPWVIDYSANPWTVWLALAHLACFLIYSAPPVRFKERGFLGPLMDGLYAHALPTAIVVSSFFPLETENLIYPALTLVVWQWFVGIRNLLAHQYHTLERDEEAGVKTWVICLGKAKAKKILAMFLFGEFLFLVPLAGWVMVVHPWLFWIMLVIAVLNFPKYLWFYQMRMNKVVNFIFFLNDHYEEWFPPISLLLLAFLVDIKYGWVLLVYLILFQNLANRFKKDFFLILGSKSDS